MLKNLRPTCQAFEFRLQSLSSLTRRTPLVFTFHQLSGTIPSSLSSLTQLGQL
jgi:hypothetical protein